MLFTRGAHRAVPTVSRGSTVGAYAPPASTLSSTAIASPLGPNYLDYYSTGQVPAHRDRDQGGEEGKGVFNLRHNIINPMNNPMINLDTSVANLGRMNNPIPDESRIFKF